MDVAKAMNSEGRASDFVPTGMKHSEFRIGLEFLTASGRWRCTDVGNRTIAAIKLDPDHDPTWYNGPPYAVVEHVLDEDDLDGLSPAPPRRTYDNSARSKIAPLDRTQRGPSPTC
jgi:hypothetical protein